MILALTNTTTANGLSPVSSTDGLLQQNGQKTTADLAANPMLPSVRSALQDLGVSGKESFTSKLLLLQNICYIRGVASSRAKLDVSTASNTGELDEKRSLCTKGKAHLPGVLFAGNSIQTIGDIANLIEDGLVYTDVHTTLRVSPEGLIRGVMSELTCPFPAPSPPSPPPSSSSPAPPPTAPSAPNNQRNPCYCSPQDGVGSDGYQ